jgi:gas vesicle protein
MKMEKIMARLITGVLTFGAIVLLAGIMTTPQVQAYQHFQDPAGMQKRAMKQSVAWKQMQTQLDQYDAHYTDATNKISQVADADVKAALTKSIRATDDCHDALMKLVKCFQDYVKANDQD